MLFIKHTHLHCDSGADSDCVPSGCEGGFQIQESENQPHINGCYNERAPSFDISGLPTYVNEFGLILAWTSYSGGYWWACEKWSGTSGSNCRHAALDYCLCPPHAHIVLVSMEPLPIFRVCICLCVCVCVCVYSGHGASQQANSRPPRRRPHGKRTRTRTGRAKSSHCKVQASTDSTRS